VPNRASGGDALRDRGSGPHSNAQASNWAQESGERAPLARDHAKHAPPETGGSAADCAQLAGSRTDYVLPCESSSTSTSTALVDATEARPRMASLYLGFGQHPPSGDDHDADDTETRL
jgi:hypothetical protein